MKNLKKLLLCCFLALSGTGCVAHAETGTSAEATESPTMLVDNEVEVSAVSATIENQEEINTYYENQVSELIEQPDEDVFTIAEGETPENTETSEVQDTEASDAKMSGSGSESEPALPADEEAVEDLETPQETPETGSEEAQERTTADIPDTVYSTRKITVPDGQTLKEYCTENGLKLVAVVDTGISEDYAVQQVNFTDETDDDNNGHGTIMASQIIKYSEDKGIVLSLKAFTSDGKGTIGNVMKALQYAIDQHADIINMSFSAIKDEKSVDKTTFEELVKSAVSNGIQVVASAGNDNADISNYIPAGIDGVISVGAMDVNKIKQPFSNYGNVSYYQYAGSTSEAAAILTGKIAGEKDLSNEVTSKTIILNSISKPNDNNTNDNYFKLSSTLVLEGIATYSGAGSWNGYTYTPNSSFVAYAPVPSGYSNSIYSCGGVDISSGGTDIRGKTFQTRESSSSGSVTRHAACSFKSGTKSTTNPNQNNYDSGLPGNGASGYITYVAHVANVGWQSWVSDGRTAGTTGQSHAIEAMALASNYVGLQYRAYASSYGWLAWKTNGHVTGSTGQSLSLQAMQINLTGADAAGYTLQYRAHIASVGWLDWVNAGGVAGQAGSGRQMEAIEIKLTPKSFYLDLNGLLDGGTSGNLGNYATADVYINGSKVATGVNDFYKAYTYGTSYKVVVNPTTGHSCNKMTFTGTIKGNTEVKPTLAANTYTVTYDANGGSGTMTQSTATYNQPFMTRQNAFTRKGYVFGGWNEKADGSGTVWGLENGGVYEANKNWTWTYVDNLTLYAQWIPVYENSTLDQTMTQYYNELNGDVQNKIVPHDISQWAYNFQSSKPSSNFYSAAHCNNSNWDEDIQYYLPWSTAYKATINRKVYALDVADIAAFLNKDSGYDLYGRKIVSTLGTDFWLRSADYRISANSEYIAGDGGIWRRNAGNVLGSRPAYQISLSTKKQS